MVRVHTQSCGGKYKAESRATDGKGDGEERLVGEAASRVEVALSFFN